ncbi:MAG: hypothetical protein RLZZ531_1036 [Bacteroidota bacterium]|jgi:hypothetical protein
MKLYFLVFISFVFFSSCNNSLNSEKELELRERELKLRERELALENNSGNLENAVSNQTEKDQNTSNSYKSRSTVKSESELRQDLLFKEGRNAKNYLSVDYDLTYKVLSGEDKITGTIFNSATIATFKDIVLTVTYSTATDAKLDKKDYVLYKYVYPGSSVPFTIKTYSPKSTKKIGVSIKSAKSE